MPSLEVVEVVLVHCNFMPIKLYTYLLNIEPSFLVFSKTYNTDPNKIIKIFTNQMEDC